MAWLLNYTTLSLGENIYYSSSDSGNICTVQTLGRVIKSQVNLPSGCIIPTLDYAVRILAACRNGSQSMYLLNRELCGVNPGPDI